MISLERPKQDNSRRDELGIVEVIELGDARLPRPVMVEHGGSLLILDKFVVVATPHNRNWPGTESNVTFAVEGYGHKRDWYGVLVMWGFFNERDCYDFLTGKVPKQYPVWDQAGNPGMSEPRTGLGIPDGYIMRYVWDADC